MFVYSAPPIYGGKGKQALTLATELVSQGIEVTLVTGQLQKVLPSKEETKGVVIRRLPAFGWGRLRPFVLSMFGVLFLLANRNHIDVVHVHGVLYSSLPILFVSRRLRKPTVLKIAGMETDDPMTISRRRFGRLLMTEIKASGRVISISREITRSCYQAGLSKEVVAQIPNGVDTTLFGPTTDENRREIKLAKNIPNDDKVVIYVGIVRPLKGSDILLQAWNRVHQENSSSRLLFVGPYDYYDRYENKNFLDQVGEFIDKDPEDINAFFLDNQEIVRPYYQMADLFVLPSLTEGLANSLLEAMACSLPVIASRVSGSSELVIHQENGLLIEPGDDSELANAIKYLLENSEVATELGQNARETILEGFSLSTVAAKYIQNYQDIVSEKQI